MTQRPHTLGILGGGQLGMMSAQAAKKLGIRTIIYTDEPNSCASRTADDTITAPYDDKQSLKSLANQCDTITYEFENIPVETVHALKTMTPVYPDEALLNISQDRITEKSYLNTIGLNTAQWLEIKGYKDIIQAMTSWKTDQIILKTTRFGYDGKGQFFVKNPSQAEEAWNALGKQTLIAEQVIDFEHEISVIVARDHAGNMVHYGPTLNTHKDHILAETHYPSGLPDHICTKAVQMTQDLAQNIDLKGLLCLELFVTRGGDLLANEIAPRTHNSGHWSIDACDASQFENHVRAVCGLPLKEPNPRPARMINLIGEDILKKDTYKQQENACVHDYGKQDIKQGRKMGHVTFL